MPKWTGQLHSPSISRALENFWDGVPTSDKLGNLENMERVIFRTSGSPARVYTQVLGKHSGRHMPLRFPRSPTTMRMQQVRRAETADSAQSRDCVRSTEVPHFEVEPIGAPSSADPTVDSMDLTQAPTFDPSRKFTTSFSRLHSLDLFPGLGLAPEDFWKLFSKCKDCHNLMTTRTVPFHICPRVGEVNGQTRKIDTKSFFLPLVDAHNVGHEAGIPEETFRALFHMCGQCGRYMTKHLFAHHSDWDEDFELEYSPENKCIYLRREEQRLMNAENYEKSV